MYDWACRSRSIGVESSFHEQPKGVPMSNAVDDGRPGVAVGHVGLKVASVEESKTFFVRHGMREIVAKENFAVLELRGGTHLVLSTREADQAPVEKCDFDLMVDDIDAAYKRFLDDGRELSEISRGRIHDSFTVSGPDGMEIDVNSSHAGDRVV